MTRRGALLGLLALPAAAAVPELVDAERTLVGDAPRDAAGGIALRVPTLAENGGQVPVTVVVDSPMTAADHITAIHLLATRNPTPCVASFRLTPALGRAEVQTRMRLAVDQEVVALAVLSDGRVRRAVGAIRVATGGCLG